MKLKNQFPKISLLISINTEEFRKFLQPMMKLNKSGCSYKSTEFHTSYYKHSEAQKTSVCSSAESTQNCFCKTGNRIVDTEEEEQQQQQWVTISIIFPFLSFFLSFFLNAFDETQFLREMNKEKKNTNKNNNKNNNNRR
jgi:hypothetical protein